MEKIFHLLFKFSLGPARKTSNIKGPKRDWDFGERQLRVLRTRSLIGPTSDLALPRSKDRSTREMSRVQLALSDANNCRLKGHPVTVGDGLACHLGDKT